MVPKLQSVVHIHDYTLCLRFADGQQGEVDLRDELWGEVFEPLRDVSVFKNFKLNTELNTITWPNGADFAPEFLYDAVTQPGNTGGAPDKIAG